MAVPAALRPRLVAPEVAAYVREAGELAELGDMAGGLAGLVRAGDPVAAAGVDRAVAHARDGPYAGCRRGVLRVWPALHAQLAENLDYCRARACVAGTQA